MTAKSIVELRASIVEEFLGLGPKTLSSSTLKSHCHKVVLDVEAFERAIRRSATISIADAASEKKRSK